MHPSTLIIIISATVLALPFPLPALGGLGSIGGISNTIVDTVDSLLGISRHHKNHGNSAGYGSECRRYDTEPITTCINKCVDLCEDGDADCNACMEGCPRKGSCGKPHDDNHRTGHHNSTAHPNK